MGKLSFGAQLFVFVVLGGALYIVFYIWFYGPMQQEIVEKDDQEKNPPSGSRERQDDGSEASPSFAARSSAKKRLSKRSPASLPSRKEVDDLLRKVQQLAAESSLDVLRFRPEATRPQDFYAEWPITLDLDGSYHNLAYFFDRLSRLSRIVNVSNLTIEAKQDPTISSTISASCTATTFVFIEQLGEGTSP